jgi:Uma2 family endonuclease
MSVSPDASWTVSGIPSAPLRRFSVDEYHCMIDAGVFGPDDRVELLNGLIIQMSPHNPPHDTCVGLSEDALRSRLPSDWILRVQASITLSQGEPEPNIAIVRGDRRKYLREHPKPSDIGLVVEISDSSLQLDRTAKSAMYARECIAAYWIVNIPEFKLEVYTGSKPVRLSPET